MVNNGKSSPTEGKPGYHGVDRRTFLRATGAGAAGTALAGCLGDGNGEGSSDGFKVGHIGPNSNPLGIGSLRSAEMAIEEINENGGINGGDVELLDEDTRADPSEAQSVTEELIQQENVDMLIGGFASEASRAVLELTADFEVPFFITGSASPALTQDFAGEDYETYKNIFRIGPINSDLQAEAMAAYCEYLKERHGWDKVAFLRDQAAWTEPFGELIPGYLEERDIEIVMEDALNIETEDFSPIMSDVDDSGADYVLRFFAHIQAGQMLGIWHDGEYEFGIEGIHVASMLPAYYQATEGVALYETTSQTGAAGVSEITEKTIPFTEAYRERYSDAENPPFRAPMYMGFNTYDGLFIAQEAVANGASPTDDLDGFVDAMLDISYTGAAGVQEFYGPDSDYPHDLKETRDDNGDILNFPVTQWQEGGEIECVYSPKYRTAEHVKPAWMR
jgi:branched-chain amino acid transport system substrate-binding protein